MRAVAAGLRGVGAGATVTATTAAGGAATLNVVPGMPYDVSIDAPPELPLARARARVVGGEAPALEVTLPDALRVSGRVLSPMGLGLAGVRVEATCVHCATPELALDETITGDAGVFTLWVPEP